MMEDVLLLWKLQTKFMLYTSNRLLATFICGGLMKQRSICIAFQKVYSKPVRGEGFQNGRERRPQKSICSWKSSLKRWRSKGDVVHYTRRRRFPTIILILCQHLSQTEALWRILQIKTPRSLSIGWFKFRLNYHRANNSTPRSHLASSAAIFNLQAEISQSLFIGV